ncbi:MAG: AraC family ligand binding domain-containing protein [Lentisphaeria bacterium]|nr:MAG: AraC family ligand binding domain-containing protein [Lentisphaeria bacterium]
MPFKFSEIQTEQEFRTLPEHYQWNHCSSANNLKFIILSTYHPQAVSPHDHDFYELVFVIRGHGTHHWRNRCGDESTMEFGLGDCFAVHPGEIHWYTGCHRLWLFNILLQKTQLEEELAPIRDMANLKQFFDRPEKNRHPNSISRRNTSPPPSKKSTIWSGNSPCAPRAIRRSFATESSIF